MSEPSGRTAGPWRVRVRSVRTGCGSYCDFPTRAAALRYASALRLVLPALSLGTALRQAITVERAGRRD